MNTLLNTLKPILFATTPDNSKNISDNLVSIADTVQKYINIVLGAFAGILVLAIIIVGAIAWFKAAKADNEQQRAAEFKKIKWLVGFILFVIIMWAISGAVTTILKSVWGAETTAKPAVALITNLFNF
ncbi:Mbov_0395 family pilin-like conjugal transfer protein [Mycoplasma feriruminatoris]|uniref:Uncharacterized protein n=1 Tax=Mycoplasma feriruminatoris TaxID=1179777 RepID=A0AAX3TIF3_9MOLU|nr:integrative conjugal element protein [Mycoplasma feriruminatoris]WFQ93051.1 hypothetical protein MFERI14822_00844 [Mycoplasma feriruminatoris]